MVQQGSREHLEREFGIAARWFRYYPWQSGTVRDSGPHELTVERDGTIRARFDGGDLVCVILSSGSMAFSGAFTVWAVTYIDAFRRMLMKLGRPFE